MVVSFQHRIDTALKQRESAGLTRRLKSIEGGNQVELSFQHHAYINFSSNDYLGLASDPELVSVWQQGLSIYGCGSGASPLVTGFSPAHLQLEQSLCEWLGFDRAVLFGSGFSANQALLFTLLEKDDLLVQDKLNHASLMEAGMLSPATMKRFKHNDVEHLATLMSADQTTLVMTEGVFSMDGDRAPLAEIQQVTDGKGWLAVDDAHGVGVLGEEGAGSCDAAGIKPDILVVTFGKAFGLSGAAILCSKEVGDYLTQFARHHVYSTAMPPAQAHTLTHAIGMIRRQQWRRDKLTERQAEFDELMADLAGFVATTTPIKPFLVGDAFQAQSIAQQLNDVGIWLTAIRPPTVPMGSARLRITLTANHSRAQVAILADQLHKALERDR
jgi:8-amino-7-oxononanoate synthase